MNTRQFYSDANVFSLLSKYINTAKTTDLKVAFDKALETLDKPECRIPVLGTQGVGKSSFLNAILFGDIILPVDANETTCIPTEIRYGDNKQPKAVIHFQNGSQKEVPCTEKALAKYVHQDNNPANSMKVSSVEILCKSDLLEKGIILVDLPGVGSLTLANQKTTLDYLNNTSAAIFMLRTVPPLTRSEAVFIQSALPLIDKAFWVQNQWTDESDDEVKEGLDDNEDKIKHIAKLAHKPDGYATRPIVVCVQKALVGHIDSNPKMVKQSRIEPFLDTIVGFARDWQSEIQDSLLKEARALVASAQAAAHERKSNYEQILAGKVDKAKAELEKQYDAAEQTKRENKEKIVEVRNFVQAEKATLHNNILELSKTGAENLKNKVREIIANGLTGGERLAKAYNDNAKEVYGEIFEEIQPQFLSMMEKTTQIIADLKPVSLSKNEIEVDGTFLDKGNKAVIAHGGKIGGGTGGTAGALIGGLIGSVIPGVGTTIGAVVGGLLGGLLGGWGGSKIGTSILEKQKDAARQELFQQIDSFKDSLEKNYLNLLENFTDGINDALRSWNKEQNNALENEYEERTRLFKASQDNVKVDLEKISKDIAQLSNLETALK
jgi:hypothetical protein